MPGAAPFGSLDFLYVPSRDAAHFAGRRDF